MQHERKSKNEPQEMRRKRRSIEETNEMQHNRKNTNVTYQAECYCMFSNCFNSFLSARCVLYNKSKETTTVNLTLATSFLLSYVQRVCV